MVFSRYSAPEFDPYGDARALPGEDVWAAPTAEGAVNATIELPGSKSLTNRELVLAALAEGPSLLRAPLHSRDSALMIEALRALGTTVREAGASGAFGSDLVIEPAAELLGSTTIDCGLAGTVMRFVPPLAALALGPTTFDGDRYAYQRPMGATIASLRSLGVDVADDGRGALPFTVHGSGSVRGGETVIDASRSSQFVSALLLASARFEEGLHLRHEGQTLPSQPHIEMTIASLAARGVTVDTPSPGEWRIAAQSIAGADVMIEPDLSTAAPFLGAALATGGRVRLRNWPTDTTQVGAHLERILPLFGALVERDGDDLVVTGGEEIRGIDLDLSAGGELAPALVALAALANGPSTVTGIGHIRHHESNRLAALATEINGLGGAVTELEDGLQIEPRTLHGGRWRTYSDHRMAHAGALIGLVVPGVQIEDIATTSKTLPQFPELWTALAQSVKADSAALGELTADGG
ncbi:3-phosphoshikimate 1-carboxyvinyltransferase [Rathayibacter toxicus]|uniref:3-phosphoshikimate 1-carboxyvinyltransferase n=1 Tax=Rathayibacter toxicus TaxID=145458 RepID=A0A0C5BFU9_9MICO|nr:3-phosphoshikimate 1-carboxyvinyltransferase [Rathayibacter toxicus]AJM77974.1 3-phosphoshikimate 1-carboxyvinyltransferase [Rathayibacter toxicus]ALS57816.1 3-phosphoshikimate 1-carboxyvinyltransferase [Rathayibacter toxicus]KKM46983.1 3-phosphoshikimate 1-carboxyvinyltransferase [Rathayibacter toxicus]PPG20515.1 3-phosphoshikimate 1-carboxyvinyltransferase [Rathayibacter toxicus]PPG45617.1 3-phosphoshikimate 1-carboxyvinyltransferase [Rathayibacter toxicus]